MYCPKCGADQPGTNKFCNKCGAALDNPRIQGGSGNSTTGFSLEDMNPKNFAYIGIVIAIIAVFFFPYILGIISIILGYVAMRRGEDRLGKITMIVGAVCTIIGLAAIYVASLTPRYYYYYL